MEGITIFLIHQISARSDFKYGCQAAGSIWENKLSAITPDLMAELHVSPNFNHRYIYNKDIRHCAEV
jgi:hypothetical protein